jgi:hypothetical protein
MEAQLDPITDIFRTMHVTAFRSAQARSHSPVGLDTGEADRRESHAFRKKDSPTDLAHFAMLSRGNCWLSIGGIPDPIPLTGGDCFLLEPRHLDHHAR